MDSTASAPARPLPWLYRAAGRLGRPRTFAGKLFLSAFLATHVPLLAVIGYLLVRGGDVSAPAVLVVTLLATLVGTGLALWALHQLLAPVLVAARALEAYLDRGEVAPLPTRHGDEAGLLLRNVALTVRTFQAQRAELERQATQDPLTGLLNRRGAERELRRALDRAARDGRPRSVALIDVDHFKRVNDAAGHPAGDALLAALGRAFAAGLRPGDRAARLGGDEFLLVLEAPLAEAGAVVERLRAAAATLAVGAPGGEVGATLSVGLAPLVPDDDVPRCLHRADAALYEAKRAGRDRLVTAHR